MVDSKKTLNAMKHTGSNQLTRSSFGLDDLGDLRISEKEIIGVHNEWSKMHRFHHSLMKRVYINQKLIR